MVCSWCLTFSCCNDNAQEFLWIRMILMLNLFHQTMSLEFNSCHILWIVTQSVSFVVSLLKKATIHQVTTMPATSENVLFPGHNHLLTTDTDDPTLWLSVPVVSRWLWLENRTFVEVAGMVTWWIVFFLRSVCWWFVKKKSIYFW